MAPTEHVGFIEKNALEELRCRVDSYLSPKLKEDPTLFHRFLKARDFDVNKAEKMLLKHITWRKINQVDTILDDNKPREYFYKYVCPTVLGADKDGDLVVYSACGKFDTADILNCEKINDYHRHWIWFLERNMEFFKNQTQKTGKECKRATCILDADKLTLSNVTNKLSAEVWIRIITLYQDNHPERMKAIILINAPAYYVFLFSILKTVMASAVVQKIRIFGQNGWKEELLNIIDADVLPAFMGGNRTDPDGNPLCLTFLNQGGKVDPSYYLTKEDRYFKDKSQVKTITVANMDKKEVHVDVTETGSVIKWEYLVKNKDIGFGLFFQKFNDSIVEEILPIEKYSTVDGTEIGSYKSQAVGKYIIIFDNSHSWFNSKEIEYCFTVIQPKPSSVK